MKDNAELINKVAELSLEDDSFYEDKATSLKSAAMVRDQQKQEFIEYLESNELQDSLARAVTSLFSLESQQILSDEEVQQLEENLSTMHSWEDKFLNPLAEVKNTLEEQKDKIVPYQVIFGFSDSLLLTIYKVGYHYFQNQDIDTALDIFTLLVTLNPAVADFNYALGLCYQQKQEWANAIVFFTLASQFDLGHVGSRISLIECHQELKNDQEVSKYLHEISHIQQEQPEKVESWLEIYTHYRK